MALIEGVGDEVTLLFGAVLLLLVLVLAWVSTHTAEPPEHLFTTPPSSVSASSSAVSASLQLRTTPSSDQLSAPGNVTTEGDSPELAPPTTLDTLVPPLGEEGKAEPQGEAGSQRGGGRIPEEGEDGEGGERSLLEEEGGGFGRDGLRRREGAVDGQTGAGPSPSSSPLLSGPLDSASSANPTSEAYPADDIDRNMVLRLKFLNDTERTAQVRPEDTIGYIKRYLFSFCVASIS